jgi:uncharacterized protein
MILDETIDLLSNKFGNNLNNIVITNVQVGILLTAVELSTSHCGVSSTFTGTYTSDYHKGPRDFDSFSPGTIRNQRVVDLLRNQRPSAVLDSAKLAALNALSSQFIDPSAYTIIEDKDPFDLLDLHQAKKVTLVGAFQSYIKKLAESKHTLRVLELNADALTTEQRRFFIPVHKAPDTIKDSDIIIITGYTLLNHTLDDLLRMIPPACQVVVVGPSSSFIPDILFRHHVNIIGSLRIFDKSKLFEVVSEAGAGFHLFRYCAKKICMVNEHA